MRTLFAYLLTAVMASAAATPTIRLHVYQDSVGGGRQIWIKRTPGDSTWVSQSSQSGSYANGVTSYTWPNWNVGSEYFPTSTIQYSTSASGTPATQAYQFTDNPVLLLHDGTATMASEPYPSRVLLFTNSTGANQIYSASVRDASGTVLETYTLGTITNGLGSLNLIPLDATNNTVSLSWSSINPDDIFGGTEITITAGGGDTTTVSSTNNPSGINAPTGARFGGTNLLTEATGTAGFQKIVDLLIASGIGQQNAATQNVANLQLIVGVGNQISTNTSQIKEAMWNLTNNAALIRSGQVTNLALIQEHNQSVTNWLRVVRDAINAQGTNGAAGIGTNAEALLVQIANNTGPATNIATVNLTNLFATNATSYSNASMASMSGSILGITNGIGSIAGGTGEGYDSSFWTLTFSVPFIGTAGAARTFTIDCNPCTNSQTSTIVAYLRWVMVGMVTWFFMQKGMAVFMRFSMWHVENSQPTQLISSTMLALNAPGDAIKLLPGTGAAAGGTAMVAYGAILSAMLVAAVVSFVPLFGFTYSTIVTFASDGPSAGTGIIGVLSVDTHIQAANALGLGQVWSVANGMFPLQEIIQNSVWLVGQTALYASIAMGWVVWRKAMPA